MNIAENIATDPQVPGCFLMKRPAFWNLLDNDFMRGVTPLLSEKLDLKRFMQLQYIGAHMVEDYLRNDCPEISWIARNTRTLLRDFELADILLRTFGCSPRTYCMRDPGLMGWEYDLMRAGCWRVRDLLERRPIAIFSPVLRAVPWEIYDGRARDMNLRPNLH